MHEGLVNRTTVYRYCNWLLMDLSALVYNVIVNSTVLWFMIFSTDPSCVMQHFVDRTFRLFSGGMSMCWTVHCSYVWQVQYCTVLSCTGNPLLNYANLHNFHRILHPVQFIGSVPPFQLVLKK